MRGYVYVMAMLLLIGPAAARADEQLKKAYDNALVQLKAAQDRKAELVKENESLAAKVEELKKELAGNQVQLESLKREIANNDDRTFFLRSYHAAWQGFIRRYPEVMGRWKVYLGDSIMSIPRESPDPLNLEWSVPSDG